MRGCLLFLLGILVGAIALGAAGAFLYGPPAVPTAPSAAYDAEVTLTPQYLQRELVIQSGQSAVGPVLQNLALGTSDNNQVVVTGTIGTGKSGAGVPLRVVIRPVAQGNRVALQILRADVGGLPVPIGLFRSLEDSMNRQIASTFGSGSYRIVGVVTSARGVSIDVTLR